MDGLEDLRPRHPDEQSDIEALAKMMYASDAAMVLAFAHPFGRWERTRAFLRGLWIFRSL